MGKIYDKIGFPDDGCCIAQNRKNENIIDKLEKILHQERKKVNDKKSGTMTIEEFNALIDSAENDAENDRMYNAGEILNDIDTWK
ncbi:MAG: hypothetical protein R6U11_01705 [Bacteroidales bacterium]